MKMYVFSDSALAEEFRKAGIAVLRTNCCGSGMYAVPDTPENARIVSTRFADAKLSKADVVCF